MHTYQTQTHGKRPGPQRRCLFGVVLGILSAIVCIGHRRHQPLNDRFLRRRCRHCRYRSSAASALVGFFVVAVVLVCLGHRQHQPLSVSFVVCVASSASAMSSSPS